MWLPDSIIQHEFPATNRYTYLNTASCGLTPRAVYQWRSDQDRRLMEEGSVFRDQHKPYIVSIRETTSRFVGVDPDRVALVPNFSSGWNVVLEGLPKGSKVLVLEDEYPSIWWPISERDLELVMVSGSADPEAALEQAVDQHRPMAVAMSLVHYITGIRIDPDFIARLKAYHPDMLILADGTQFMGTAPFHFDSSGIDVLGASAYKWMMGGYGCGFFALSALAEQKLRPSTLGYNSADRTQGSRVGIPLAARLEPGHQDTLSLGSMEQSLLWTEQHGWEAAFAHLESLREQAKAAFIDRGWVAEYAANRPLSSNIFSLRLPEGSFERMQRAGIITSLRGSGVRVSFHLYNTKADLEKLLQVLDQSSTT